MEYKHERPFLFSSPLVLAILDGRKTVTRRLLAGSEDIVDQPGDVWEQAEGRVDGVGHKSDRGRWILIRGGAVVFASRPTHIPGDGMWVRETWRACSHFDHLKPSLVPIDASVSWEATASEARRLKGRIRQSIFLPRWASRITRKVTRVVVERLQDITEEQARAEGVPRGPSGQGYLWGFKRTWESINGKVTAKRWATNPLVTATTFEGP